MANKQILTALKEIKTNKALLIDVREKSEWNKQHFIHAISLPLSELKLGKIPKDLTQDKTLYVHCQKGIRAITASKILSKQYNSVKALEYSFKEISENGFNIK